MSNEFKETPRGDMEYSVEGGDRIKIEWAGEMSSWVYVECYDGSDGELAGIYVPAAALVEAIEKVAGIKGTDEEPKEPETHSPEPLWIEVRERPSLAVKVTPELVRTLAGTREHTELRELEPRFSPHNGSPAGVSYENAVLETVHVRIGEVVVLRHGKYPISMGVNEFERLFEVAA